MKDSKSLLIVEDEVLIAMTLEMDLIKDGYRLLNTVTTGEEAVSFIKKSINTNKPDIILLDIHLAGKMDGIETAARIRELTQSPIIFMTGYSNKKYKEQAKGIDNSAYLVKPLYTSAVKAAIKNFTG